MYGKDMMTDVADVRANISENNQYYIPKHRFYELKYFSLQYPYWVDRLEELEDGYTPIKAYGIAKGEYYSNPVERTVMYREQLKNNVDLVEKRAKIAGEEIWEYILKSVTNGYSYNFLRMRLNIPCGKDMFYERRRKYFWVLDKLKKSAR